jgi:hypothetical protein
MFSKDSTNFFDNVPVKIPSLRSLKMRLWSHGGKRAWEWTTNYSMTLFLMSTEGRISETRVVEPSISTLSSVAAVT